MSKPQTNGPLSQNEVIPADKAGDTTTISCDELIEFEENDSQPASAWPWPEPPFEKDHEKTESQV